MPWCSILGDHDVQENSYANFLRFMSQEKVFAFTVGHVRFVAMNAFDLPDPGSFTILPPQLEWAEDQLRQAQDQKQMTIVLLHCYPSDLKHGAADLRKLLLRYNVRLVEMGHTHYNEIANDGHLLYAATRSTGQIEEGPVGFSVTNLDGDVISWKFLLLDCLPAVVITSPSDHRFILDPARPGSIVEGTLVVRAKVWSVFEITRAEAVLAGHVFALERVGDTRVWQGEATLHDLPDGIHELSVTTEDERGAIGRTVFRS